MPHLDMILEFLAIIGNVRMFIGIAAKSAICYQTKMAS